MILSLAQSKVLWQIGLLPVRLLVWIGVPICLILLFPVQLVTGLLSKQGFFAANPYGYLLGLLGEGRSSQGNQFDRRYILFHTQMNGARFADIVLRKSEFVATEKKLRVCQPGEVAVPYVGLFEQGMEYDDAHVDDYIVVPSSLTGAGGDHFALRINNQGGLGVGVNNGDFLVFQRLASTPAQQGEGVVVSRGQASLQSVARLADCDPTQFAGVLVGSIPE